MPITESLNMLKIDDTNLILDAINNDGVGHASVLAKKRIKEVLLNGCKVPHAYYANTEKGILIKAKTTLEGCLITVDGKPVHEIKFGKVEIIYV